MKMPLFPKRPAALTAALTTLLVLLPTQAAESPHLIPFQGHLARPLASDAQKFEAVPNGQYDILFTLYVAPVGGESKVWGPERHTKIVVVNGLVNALLGSVIGFANEVSASPNFFNRPLYVGITIDADGNPNTADLELVPRQVMLPSLQALNSSKLDGSDWQDFFVGTDGNGTFSLGTTKAKDADLFDGIDSPAIFVDPTNKISPKVKRALTADGIAGNLDVTGNMGVTSNLTISGNLTLGGSVSSNLSVLGNLTLGGKIHSSVESVVGGNSFFMVPRGAIVMWSGDVANIPPGWALCDGSNGTPNLSDRFVMGFNPLTSTNVIGQVGGTTNHTHSVDIPSTTTSNVGATAGVAAIYNGSATWFTVGHSHTVNPQPTTSTATDHIPPYVRLGFIMKL